MISCPQRGQHSSWRPWGLSRGRKFCLNAHMLIGCTVPELQLNTHHLISKGNLKRISLFILYDSMYLYMHIKEVTCMHAIIWKYHNQRGKQSWKAYNTVQLIHMLRNQFFLHKLPITILPITTFISIIKTANMFVDFCYEYQ